MLNKNHSKRKRRAMTTKTARKVKLDGHKLEEIFAKLINGKPISGTGKKDVLDKRNKVYSIKGAQKKWQIFLYARDRFKKDRNIPGREFIIKCIDSFPNSWEKYKKNKKKYKQVLQPCMKDLKDFLSKKNNKLAFFSKSFLEDSDVDYLVIRDDNVFCVFDGEEAVKTIDRFTDVENSKSRGKGQMDALKVVFKEGETRKTTIGEIELRTDRKEKFRRVKFWMLRNKTLNLLKEKITTKVKKNNNIIAYGKARKSFRL